MIDQVRARADSSEIEIFGFNENLSPEGALCCRWKVGYIREISSIMIALGNRATPIQFDWLEKTARPSFAARVNSALTITRQPSSSSSLIGVSRIDPWVRVNSNLEALFRRLHPQATQGRFFERWGTGDGEGRLRFVEWFKKLLLDHRDRQAIIFDPYFEDVGLALLLLGAQLNSDYVVFRSQSKAAPNTDGVQEADNFQPHDETTHSDGARNLVALCQANSEALRRFRLRVFALKEGRLHDRFILFMGADGLAVAGYHLSNSFQKAAENYPLLVTPIPSDTLIEVEKYQYNLMRAAEAAAAEKCEENQTIRCLFDSKLLPTRALQHEPLRFLEKDHVGNVLSILADAPSLATLSGEPLKAQMTELGLLSGNSLTLPPGSELSGLILQHKNDFSGFAPIWDVVADILAHSTVRDYGTDLEDNSNFLSFLVQFLQGSFIRPHVVVGHEVMVIDDQLFGKTLTELLHSGYDTSFMAREFKYALLNWSEFYAIKLLWRFSPSKLTQFLEDEIASLLSNQVRPGVLHLSILGQCVNEIAQSLEFGVTELQQRCLLSSKADLLRWIGLNAVESKIGTREGFSFLEEMLANEPQRERLQVLGWMTSRASHDTEKSEVYGRLIQALHASFGSKIGQQELKQLVDSLRGRFGALSWAEPWLFRDIVAPLLPDRASCDDAFDIWISEVIGYLESAYDSNQSFSRGREGQTTAFAALLLANVTPLSRQAATLRLEAVLRKQRRVLRQPLASTTNWSKWNKALENSLWIHAFTLWSLYYLHTNDDTDTNIETLSESSRELAFIRPEAEWLDRLSGSLGELPAFYAQALERFESTLVKRATLHPPAPVLDPQFSFKDRLSAVLRLLPSRLRSERSNGVADQWADQPLILRAARATGIIGVLVWLKRLRRRVSPSARDRR